MTVTVVTGFSPRGLEEYGWNFIKGFCENWPVEVKLVIYLEEPIFDVRLTPIDKFIDGKRRDVTMRTFRDVPRVPEFIDRHMNDPAANGCDVQPNWKERERKEGYNFRWDAVKWCRMAMFAADAARNLAPESRILVWLDGDVMTNRPIPPNFVEDLVGDHDVAYLGREPKHPDTAFVVFQGNFGLLIAERWGELYESDDVFMLPETHSAYVFKYCLEFPAHLAQPKRLNLTPKGHGHVWFQSPLAAYMDHLKGKRKLRGRSREWK